MINGNACFAYFNKNWGIPSCQASTSYCGPTETMIWINNDD
jgi:hypothetical protein